MDAQATTSPAGRTDPRWIAVFGRLMQTEGGFVDSPSDHGGATNYGLSLRFLSQAGDLSPALRAELDINNDGEINVPDIKGMTIATAEDVYFAEFWPAASQLPAPLDAAVFDQIVNDGQAPAIKLLQAAVNSLAVVSPALAVDGVLGPATRAAVDAAVASRGSDQALDAYRAQAAARYRRIVANDPSQARFENGWLRRAAELGDV